MESGKQFNALLQVLSGEQQVIQRTDQKAFTLLSILGVSWFFSLSTFQNTNESFHFLMMIIYFTSAMGTIYYLVQVIVPRFESIKLKLMIKRLKKMKL